MAAQFGADLRTAALQFSAAPDVAVALIVGAHTEAQVLANVSSMQSTIPPEFWAELKTAEPYRAERARAYGVEILKTAVAKYVKMN